MKKFYLNFSFIVLLSCLSQAQFKKQYFDGADTSKFNSIHIKIDPDTTNIWQIGKPQKVLFNSAATAPRVIVTDTLNNYPAKNQSRFTTVAHLNFQAFGIYAIQWMQKLNMDSTDIGLVEFTTNKGVSWQNAFNNPLVYNFYGFNSSNTVTAGSQVGFSKTDTTWKNVWLCFSTSWMTQFPDSVMFRFTFKSDSLGTGKEGWMIDNFFSGQTIIHTALSERKGDGKYISIFPNPADNILHIEVEALKQYHLIEVMELIGPDGKIIQTWNKIPTKYWIDTSPYKEGNYLLKVQTNLKSETLPFIIKRN